MPVTSSPDKPSMFLTPAELAELTGVKIGKNKKTRDQLQAAEVVHSLAHGRQGQVCKVSGRNQSIGHQHHNALHLRRNRSQNHANRVLPARVQAGRLSRTLGSLSLWQALKV